MRKLLFIIKLITCFFFIGSSIFLLYLIYLSPQEKRFAFAENAQGTLLSQKFFDILIKQQADFSEAYFEKSVPFNKRGDYSNGFKLLDKAVEIDPVKHLGYRGWIKLKKIKDYKGALNDFNQLDTLTPNVIDAPWGENINYLKGLCYKGLKQNETALNEFNIYINAEKDSSWVNPNVFLYVGLIHLDFHNYKLALKSANTCLKYNGNSPEGHYLKAIIFKFLKKDKEFDQEIEMSKKLFKAGYKSSDVYNEVTDELYWSDIISHIKEND